MPQVSNDSVTTGVLTDMTGKGLFLAAKLAVKEFGDTVLDKPIPIVVPITSTRPMSAARCLRRS